MWKQCLHTKGLYLELICYVAYPCACVSNHIWLMTQSHFYQSLERLVCSDLPSWKLEGLAGCWPGAGGWHVNHRWNNADWRAPFEVLEENNFQLFSCNVKGLILHSLLVFQNPTSILGYLQIFERCLDLKNIFRASLEILLRHKWNFKLRERFGTYWMRKKLFFMSMSLG